MQRILFCIPLFFAFAGQAQQTFVLNGTVTGRDTGRMVLGYFDPGGNWFMDTTYLAHGRFRFSGPMREPTKATLIGPEKYVDFVAVSNVDVYLEPGIQTVTLTEGNYSGARLSGSATQRDFEALQHSWDSVKAPYKPLFAEMLKAKYAFQDAATDDAKQIALKQEGAIQQRITPIGVESDRVDVAFVRAHPASYISPWECFGLLMRRNLPVDSVAAMFGRLEPAVRNSGGGRFFAARLQRIRQNSDGNLAYGFHATDNHGNGVSLAAFSGKYVLLDFWASWCVPCREALPGLKELYRQYHPRNLDIITISVDRDATAWKKAVADESLGNWTNVLANKDITANYDYVQQPIPAQMLIAPDGKIIWKSDDNTTLPDALQKMVR